MKALVEVCDKKKLDDIMEQAATPTIISIARTHSFGAKWLSRILASVRLKYEDRITVHDFYLEDPAKMMSLLGEGKSMIIYFMKDKEIKSRITGSVSKSTFNQSLSTIIK